MPIENNKPPDPLVDEFCILTKMTSAEDLCSASFDETKVKAHRSIKVSTPGSAGAGSVLRRLRSGKIAGKARVRAEGSPSDDRGECTPDIGFKSSPVAKSCGLKTSHEHTSLGDVGNTGVGIASSKDGIAIA
nr:hypothetical protein [Tanacetum cinerariifolium]